MVCTWTDATSRVVSGAGGGGFVYMTWSRHIGCSRLCSAFALRFGYYWCRRAKTKENVLLYKKNKNLS